MTTESTKLPIDSTQEQPNAWQACAQELEQALPGSMSTANGRAGVEAAIEAIRTLAARAKAEYTAPVLNDAWKARLLDGAPLVRDEIGCGFHPALPDFDENVNARALFATLGIELKGVMAEDEMDSDAYDAMTDSDKGVDYNVWNPVRPSGDGWNLVAVFDTEDGPACWWVREKPHQESQRFAAADSRDPRAQVSLLAGALVQAEAGLEVAVGRFTNLSKGGVGRFKPCEVLALECVRAALESIARPLRPAHQDDAAVDTLAIRMKTKLAQQRSKGYGGWDTDCTQERLSGMLRNSVSKGDPIDVANFCAFLIARGEAIAPPAASAVMAEPDERAAFEMVASDNGRWPKAIERDANGNYLLMVTASGWSWWQAARRRTAGADNQGTSQ